MLDAPMLDAPLRGAPMPGVLMLGVLMPEGRVLAAVAGGLLKAWPTLDGCLFAAAGARGRRWRVARYWARAVRRGATAASTTRPRATLAGRASVDWRRAAGPRRFG